MNHHINPSSGLYQSLANDQQKRILKASEEAQLLKSISTKKVKEASQQSIEQHESGFSLTHLIRSFFARSKHQPV